MSLRKRPQKSSSHSASKPTWKLPKLRSLRKLLPFSLKPTAVGFSENGNSFLSDRNFGSFQVGFDAEWELDFWGRFRSDIQAQTAEHLASIADYQAALVSVNAEVARTYAVIRSFEALVAQTRENVTLQEEGLRIAEARFRHGAT